MVLEEETSQNVKKDLEEKLPTSQNVEIDPLQIVITPNEFSLKGSLDVPPKFWYLLIAVLCASLGLSYEEIIGVVM